MESVAADLSVEMTITGRCLLASVSGAMDHVAAPVLRSRLKELISGGSRFIVVDLTHVAFCDSAGLSVLLGVRRQAEEIGALLVLANVPQLMLRILEMTGADQVLRVFDTVPDTEGVLGG
ncbi:STAS domain-containing protein [Streptomyces sp. NPDC002285]